jgi:hypothetical protein
VVQTEPGLETEDGFYLSVESPLENDSAFSAQENRLGSHYGADCNNGSGTRLFGGQKAA